MILGERVPLAPYTSFGLGGPARFFAEAASARDLSALREAARERGLATRLMGAGTNLLVPDAGVDALVVRMTGAACTIEAGDGDSLVLAAGAGARFDDLVDLAASRDAWGIENLAGIPGSAGGALVQNIGAYGAELAETFAFAEILDLASGEVWRVGRSEAALGYRTSLFKGRRDLAILSITLTLHRAGGPKLAYADLARAEASGMPLETPREVASAVRAIRAAKFPERGCAGSFFKNPVISPEDLAALTARYPDLPSYPAGNGAKIPLAWLLDHALALAGYRRGLVRLFERQPLVVVASEGASAAAVEALAHEIEARVFDAFGITLEREVETFS